ncbi:MAG TPA: tRNA 2-thiouridine(34) synthase MnmA [Candidatus Eisenbacteria bacterium]|jgi:tRNA-specific 2-thiouridylase|nr:tRNA 2-thiouridine(34) synthase MnmA [Candidatus Eisenbacteria bacterium]
MKSFVPPGKSSVLVAMSGGVDSCVAAALLHRAGHDVIGVTMKLWCYAEGPSPARGCCTLDAIDDCRAVARRIGFPHYVLDMEDDFKEHVIENFVGEYMAGRTPNPCVQCNNWLKFGELLRRAESFGCNYVATGHYARRGLDESGRATLHRAVDVAKDQSYVLWGLSQRALQRSLFPLGEMTKDQVRAAARDLALPVADKKESQDICFVEGKRYLDFLRERYPDRVAGAASGEVRDASGTPLARHDGIHAFTIGQRRGVGVASGRRLYVSRIEPRTATVVVDDESALYRSTARLSRVNYLDGETPAGALSGDAKIRYLHAAASAQLLPGVPGEAEIRFQDPQRAMTPGQSLVLYSGDRVVAGGVIDHVA